MPWARHVIVGVVAVATAAGCGGRRRSSPVVTDVAATCARQASPSPSGSAAIFIDIDAGADHTCGVTPERTVRCWGANEAGQLDTRGIVGATDVAAGQRGSCAVTADGRVWCWGLDSYAGRGLRSSGQPHAPPMPVQGIDDAIAVDVGVEVACAVRRGGSVACWGAGANPIVGDATRSSGAIPVAIAGIANAAEIALGSRFACVRDRDGRVGCWGAEGFATPIPGGAAAIAADGDRACAVLADGAVACWRSRRTPELVARVRGAQTVAVGATHACAVDRRGETVCWGRGAEGQLGIGDLGAVETTAALAVPDLHGTRMLSAGQAHNCALSETGEAVCWGANAAGQLGALTDVAHAVPAPACAIADATAAAVGRDHTCVVRRAGTVACFGGNDAGQLGRPASLPIVVPVDVPGLDDVFAIAAGGDRTCALREGGHVMCWGAGAGATPTEVSLLTAALELTASTRRTCARLVDGRVSCWEDDLAAAIVEGLAPVSSMASTTDGTCFLHDDGAVSCWGGRFLPPSESTTIDAMPQPVQRLPDVRRIAGGDVGLCMLADAAVQCRSDLVAPSNSFESGELANADDLAVAGDEVCTIIGGQAICRGGAATWTLDGRIASIAGGSSHSCAVRRDGLVLCWGQNLVGQLGTSTSGNAYSAVRVAP